MRKISFLLALIFIFNIIGANVVMAQEGGSATEASTASGAPAGGDPTLKVYVSEPLNSKNIVKKVTKCMVEEKKEIVRCTAGNCSDNVDYCVAGDRPNARDCSDKNKRQDGAFIMECPPTKPNCSEDEKIFETVHEPVGFKGVEVGQPDLDFVFMWVFELVNCKVTDVPIEQPMPEANYLQKNGSGGWDSVEMKECIVPDPFPYLHNIEPTPLQAEYVKCETLGVIKSSSGVGLLTNYIGDIYQWAGGIVGIVAVLIIVISGIQIMSGGVGENAGAVEAAKTRIMQSLAGLILLFLSGLLLYTINPNFFV